MTFEQFREIVVAWASSYHNAIDAKAFEYPTRVLWHKLNNQGFVVEATKNKNGTYECV